MENMRSRAGERLLQLVIVHLPKCTQTGERHGQGGEEIVLVWVLRVLLQRKAGVQLRLLRNPMKMNALTTTRIHDFSKKSKYSRLVVVHYYTLFLDNNYK